MRDILAEIVMHKADLRVESELSDRLIQIRFQQHVADAKRLVGTGGATFKAMQIIAKYFGMKNRVMIRLMPIEMPDRTDPRCHDHGPFRKNSDWPKDRIFSAAERLAHLGFFFPEVITISSVHRNCESDLIMTHAGNEKDYVAGDMAKALGVLVGTAAKANGWVVVVKLIEGEAVECQPDSAAGRFER